MRTKLEVRATDVGPQFRLRCAEIESGMECGGDISFDYEGDIRCSRYEVTHIGYAGAEWIPIAEVRL